MIVLVGQAPSRTSDPARPFSGKSGERLEALAGLEKGELASRAVLLNLLGRWWGKNGKGDAFPMKRARAAASNMAFYPRDRVVLAGSLVAEAFGVRSVAYFEWQPRGVGRAAFAVIPHPSGVNRWWNSDLNARRAKAFLWGLFQC